MRTLVVIAGPASSGKFPLAKKLMAEDPSLVMVHRDTLREALITKIDEWDISQVMRAVANMLLCQDHSVIVCAWNLEQEDRDMWRNLSIKTKSKLRWLDTRDPEVAAMIPPMEETNG